MVPCAAKSICNSFYERLSDVPEPALLHSRFERAVNLLTPHGLFTVLRGGELFPYGAVTENGECALFSSSFGANTSFTLCRSGIAFGDTPLVSFQEAVYTDLRATQMMESAATNAFDAAALSIQKFLQSGCATDGLSVLTCETAALGRFPCAAFFKPRFEAFRAAARGRGHESTAGAAARCAGLGIGLTPSSDDCLCGYFAVESAVFSSAWLMDASRAAAKSTAYLSAQFLLRAGEGLVSEAVLALFLSIARQSGAYEPLLRRIASHGATSGCDFLTGTYFGLLDAAEKRRNCLASVGNP